MSKLSTIQESVEDYWRKVERQTLMAKKSSHIELKKTYSEKWNRGKDPRWSKADVEKLKSNIRRPVSELVAILKNKYSWEKVKAKKIQLLKKEGVIMARESRSKVTKECFFEICKTIKMSGKNSYSIVNSAFPGTFEYDTFTWWRYLIKKELLGEKSKLSALFRDYLNEWYVSTTGETLPERGSGVPAVSGIKYRKLNRKKKGSKVKGTSVQKAPVEKVNADEPVVEEVNAEEPIIEEIKVDEPAENEPIIDVVDAPDVNHECSCHCECNNNEPVAIGYGLWLDNSVASFNSDVQYVKGAQSVYLKLGLNPSIVKLHIYSK